MHCHTKIDAKVNFDINSLCFNDVILWHIIFVNIASDNGLFSAPNFLRYISRDITQYLGKSIYYYSTMFKEVV